MRVVLIPIMIAGGVFGWVWKRGHYAWQDLQTAKARIRGARKVFRRETVWTLGFIVIAALVVRALI